MLERLGADAQAGGCPMLRDWDPEPPPELPNDFCQPAPFVWVVDRAKHPSERDNLLDELVDGRLLGGRIMAHNLIL